MGDSVGERCPNYWEEVKVAEGVLVKFVLFIQRE